MATCVSLHPRAVGGLTHNQFPRLDPHRAWATVRRAIFATLDERERERILNEISTNQGWSLADLASARPMSRTVLWGTAVAVTILYALLWSNHFYPLSD